MVAGKGVEKGPAVEKAPTSLIEVGGASILEKDYWDDFEDLGHLSWVKLGKRQSLAAEIEAVSFRG
jgi:hypothetical protein